MEFYKKKAFLLVTGASRGIGRAIAEELATKLDASGTRIVLMGRTADGLAETKAAIEKKFSDINESAPDVCVVVGDIAQTTQAEFKNVLADGAEQYDCAIIVHNAGTVGDTTQHARDAANSEVWQDYFCTNFFSMVTLNGEFMHRFAHISKLVINISSLAAIEPISSMVYYCSGKAARELYFKVLALEELSTGRTFVLNYAPGIVNSAMTVKIQLETHDSNVAKLFREQRESKRMLEPTQAAFALVSLLENRAYVSGEHVDFSDLKEKIPYLNLGTILSQSRE